MVPGTFVCVQSLDKICDSLINGNNWLCAQKLKSSIQPNIYECPICKEHNCDHDVQPGDALEPEGSVQELTPIMTVPSSLSAAANEYQHQQQLNYLHQQQQLQQQQLTQAQAYAQQTTQLQSQRPQRPTASSPEKPRLLLQDPPPGHPHKNGTAPASNNASSTTSSNGTTATDEVSSKPSADRFVIADVAETEADAGQPIEANETVAKS